MRLLLSQALYLTLYQFSVKSPIPRSVYTHVGNSDILTLTQMKGTQE